MTDSTLPHAFEAGDSVYYDLTHSAPTFASRGGDLRPDLAKPFAASRPVCGHGFQGVRVLKPNFEVANGYFQWGYFYLDEHYATHVDSQCHFITTAAHMKIDSPDERCAHEFSLAELIGPIVYIDISERVERELARNGGLPSPDKSITDFGNTSEATIRLRDISALEEYITDGTYIVCRTGWDRHYEGEGPANGWYHPYSNGLNHPGITPEVVDWLVALEQRKNIRINGFVSDNIAVESGESLLGDGGSVDVSPARLNGVYLHAIGLPRGWKLVENATNLGLLARHAQGTGRLIVGASRIVGASGAPARVIAVYPRP